ncbi:glycoside hydrolase family 3 C-terminal domain-containing protein [Leifsonia sp. H3M29-4]|uniref:glycoside hydrolase family 3 C-terminal domain-containing protein n=1 Tax=Salinibacterium metalliresistens TaxID=3031321 RepID=UPI0023DB468F|nr:glycoside hydrolase family 3 C-terminal domain-containing protein [Salinibacterium metalliresistens]MDF1477812.1 glycoside hydrolase family 3 C-terminal domain-containing protein [Salinibacterium metalliresistens]
MTRELTLEEKAAITVGAGYWRTVAAPGLESIVLADGPHGLRRQPEEREDHLGLGGSLPATCFPPAAGLASSWNPALVQRVGAAIGDEAREQGVAVVLGPGVNIKRSPLCGRNFEYFSEDPLLSGELGAAWVRGAQSRGIGASLKHFAANNQETDRMTVSAEVDERTLREIYLPAFERVVTAEQPWTVMCSYNRINGVPAAEHHWLLTEVLRDEWGFEGLVVSDWGAVDTRVPALQAGLDLEMPGPQSDSVAAIVAAVRDGSLAESVLDTAVARVRALVDRAVVRRDPVSAGSTTAHHHALAREAATQSMVLLRNEGDLLPLETAQSIAVIGEFARTPRIQGAGSSQVIPTRVDTALEAIAELAPVEFAPGYALGRHDDADALIAEAVEVAERADAVLLFVGLPAGDESEGYDRTHLALPSAQVLLIAAVAAVNPRTVVILTNGGVVSLEPWHDLVPAVLETWLLGQAAGSAIAEVVFGVVAPSGRLAESIPLRLEDNPSYLNFPGERDVVRYGEGVFVGYRHYETVGRAVRYPFGHGLTYTRFDYADLEIARDGVRVAVTVTNVGDRAGADVVQLYIGAPKGPLAVPRRELRAFERIELEPGQAQRVVFELDRRAYSHWDVEFGGWNVAGGDYAVEIARSAHDIALAGTVSLRGPRPRRLTLDSRVSEYLEHPVTGPILARATRGSVHEDTGHADGLRMVASMPMRRLMRFPGVGDGFRRIGLLLAVANNRVIRGLASALRRR